jgi:hypothetical protein
MTSSTPIDADALRQLLLQAAVNGEAGQQALERLYRHYDPLIRAALPKGLQPQDAEDLVMDTWEQVLDEVRHGRRLRRHEDVIALIAATLREATPSTPGRPLAQSPARLTIWQRLVRFVRLLLPDQDPS